MGSEINKPFRVSLNGQGDLIRRIPEGPKMFLRLMPNQSVDRIAEADLLEKVLSSELWPLGHERYDGWSIGRNIYGVCRIARHPKSDALVGAIVQAMPTREIWGIETYLLTPAARQASLGNENRIIQTTMVRRIFSDALQSYIIFAQSRLGLVLPLVAIAGMVNISGYALALPHNQISDIMFQDIVFQEIIIDDINMLSEDLLRPFFASMYDAVGIRLSAGQ
jgi:hypothetical protein